LTFFLKILLKAAVAMANIMTKDELLAFIGKALDETENDELRNGFILNMKMRCIESQAELKLIQLRNTMKTISEMKRQMKGDNMPVPMRYGFDNENKFTGAIGVLATNCTMLPLQPSKVACTPAMPIAPQQPHMQTRQSSMPVPVPGPAPVPVPALMGLATVATAIGHNQSPPPCPSDESDQKKRKLNGKN
jgi:hypothetical protein